MSEQELSVIVGGKEYQLVKKGYEQAQQVTALSKWLAEHGIPIFEKLSTEAGEQGLTSNTDLFKAVLDNLSPDALVELFAVIVGCTPKVAKAEFDIGILIDSATTVWDNQPGLRRLVNRFFFSTDSEEDSE